MRKMNYFNNLKQGEVIVTLLFVIVTSLVLKNGNMCKLDLPVWSTEFHGEL